MKKIIQFLLMYFLSLLLFSCSEEAIENDYISLEESVDLLIEKNYELSSEGFTVEVPFSEWEALLDEKSKGSENGMSLVSTLLRSGIARNKHLKSNYKSNSFNAEANCHGGPWVFKSNCCSGVIAFSSGTGPLCTAHAWGNCGSPASDGGGATFAHAAASLRNGCFANVN